MKLKNYGIKVMVVAPGAIKSEIGNANIRNLKLRERMRNLILREQDDPEIWGSDVDGTFFGIVLLWRISLLEQIPLQVTPRPNPASVFPRIKPLSHPTPVKED